MYYHGARYYAPWLGRWTACDPPGMVDGPNLYVYAANSPVILADPSGTQSEPPVPSAPPGPPGTQVNFYEWRAFFQRVTATAAGRGFTSRMYANALKVYQMWGGVGTPDLAHVEKPFALTRAGETTHVAPQEPSVNQAYGRTVDKANVAAARARGEFTRVADVDPGATKGTRFGQPQQSDFFQSKAFRDWRPAAAPQMTPATPPPAAAPSTAAARPVPEQLSLPFDKPPSAPASSESPSPAKPKGRLLGRTMHGAGIAAISGEVLVQLHEGRPGEAAKTAAVGGGAMFVLSKVPALVPLAVMASSIQASKDPKIERHAFAAGDWVAERTHPVVGAFAAAGVATGESVFEGTFGMTGRAIGEGAAVAYIRLTSDEYTLNPLKSQAWADFKSWF